MNPCGYFRSRQTCCTYTRPTSKTTALSSSGSHSQKRRATKRYQNVTQGLNFQENVASDLQKMVNTKGPSFRSINVEILQKKTDPIKSLKANLKKIRFRGLKKTRQSIRIWIQKTVFQEHQRIYSAGEYGSGSNL